jgi:hypothetical protein
MAIPTPRKSDDHGSSRSIVTAARKRAFSGLLMVGAALEGR